MGLLSFGLAFNFIFVIEGSGLPFLIMFFSSVIMIKTLRDSRHHVEIFSSVDQKKKSRDRKFAVTSITFNVLFIALKMPLLVVTLIGYNFVSTYLYYIALALYFLNYSISFLVHFFTNSLFRKELFILLRFRNRVADSIDHPNQTNANKNQSNRV